MNKATDGGTPIVAEDTQSERSNVEMTLSSQVLETSSQVLQTSSADVAEPPATAQTTAARVQEFDPSLAERLVVVPAISPLALEQYRRLAAALHRRQLQHRIKKVLVASALASEGKTLTAVNLALTFSESYGRNVLLIDGDMRRPTTHQVLQVPNLLGLNVGLKEEAGQKLELIQVTKHLAVLTAGEPESDPMSRLTSNRMRQVLHEASTKFDWVIIDTPPAGRRSRWCSVRWTRLAPIGSWAACSTGSTRRFRAPRASTTSTTGAGTPNSSKTDALQTT
jgi:Mrp family chromosome partitioning ATPase